MNRDEARLLARQFAVQLRHLREFRGQAYVGAAPLPIRGAARADIDTTTPSAPASTQADAAQRPTSVTRNEADTRQRNAAQPYGTEAAPQRPTSAAVAYAAEAAPQRAASAAQPYAAEAAPQRPTSTAQRQNDAAPQRPTSTAQSHNDAAPQRPVRAAQPYADDAASSRPGTTSPTQPASRPHAGTAAHHSPPSQRVGEPSQPAPHTWPSGQVDTPGDLRDAVPSRPTSDPRRSAPAGSQGAPRDPAVASRPEIAAADPARETWPSGQVAGERARADRTATMHADASPLAGRSPVRLPTLPAEDPPAADAGVRDKARTWTAAEKLDYLRRKNIGNCQRCKLAATRTQIVFGVGDPEADVMFIGEAPGFDEDREGEPFVGAAGRRLTQWLGRLGLRRDQVYIANVLKCRPPGNRDPEHDEVERCSPFLRAQIRAIAPKVIVALGRHAGMLLLGGQQERTLREMRGRSWEYKDPSGAHQAALFVTYHPSYVIRRERELSPGQRNPADDTVMADLQQALSSTK